MAYTFLKAKGINIGKSILDEENIEFCKGILANYPEKIVLPIDNLVTKEFSNDVEINVKDVENIGEDEMGMDIGPKSIELFSNVLDSAKIVFWNGPLGYSEIDKYSNGTKEILKHLSNSKKTVIIGGGDTASSAINFGYKNSFTHISTGGGATLELLEGKKLPGVEIIDER